jgi:hypothetical protein
MRPLPLRKQMKRTDTRILAAATVCLALLTIAVTPAAHAQCGPSLTPRAVAWNLTPALAAPKLAPAPAPKAEPEAKANPQANQPSIAGLWMTTFLAGGQIVDQGFDVWHSDGTELLNDNPPPASGNVCVGVWVQTDRNSYRLYHPSWTFDAKGNVNGTAIIRETVSVDAATGDTFKGTFTVDYYDLAGNHLTTQSVSGQLTGQRIVVD